MASSKPKFIWSANAEGLDVRFSNRRRFESARQGRGTDVDRIAFIRMQMLAESGRAEVQDVDLGIFIAAADAVRLDSETREGFELPPIWPGGMRLHTESVPQLEDFRAILGLVSPEGTVIWKWNLRGPILEAEGASYLPTAAQYAALKAYTDHLKTDKHDEYANLALLATLSEARSEGCHIDLEAYKATTVSRADEITLDVRPDVSGTGDLILRPVVGGDFPALDPDRIEERLAQLRIGEDRTVLRVGQTIVLLNPEQTVVARATAERGRVPSEEREKFIKKSLCLARRSCVPGCRHRF